MAVGNNGYKRFVWMFVGLVGYFGRVCRADLYEWVGWYKLVWMVVFGGIVNNTIPYEQMLPLTNFFSIHNVHLQYTFIYIYYLR